MRPENSRAASHGPGASSAGEESRLLRATQEYRAALEGGRRPNRQQFLARHADIAAELAECLDGLELVHAAASELRQLGPADTHLAGGEGQPPAVLGEYRIVREIGRGGMGIVYEAEQVSLGRRVALKVLPFAAGLDTKHLQRFKNEAQAAAHLRHPNIVPVYGVGCDRGVHFYAMQLIDGQTLAVAIHQWRQTSGLDPSAPTTAPHPPPLPGPPTSQPRLGPGPGSRASTVADAGGAGATSLPAGRGGGGRDFYRRVVDIGLQAATALEHAHQVGIVHRDVKPANLLVDAAGHVWVTDFGLAQFSADAGLTQTGDLLGTLRYMSPEQAAGLRVGVDHRTDVYSLGATLYELLTLRPIFDGADRQALLRQILHEEPRPPRSVDRSIPAELATIVLKALGKAPEERYATAGELADDLRRFLEHRPIRARRPSLVEKARKWARRHRGVVGSAVIALVLSVAGLGAVTVLKAQAYDRERQKAKEADEQRARAEESFQQARRVVDELARIGEEELAGKPFAEGARRRLLETALAYYQEFIQQRRDDPSTQKELEASRTKAQAILGELTALMGARRYLLLQEPAVQDELQLSAQQRDAVARIDREIPRLPPEFPRPGPEERERRMLALVREQEATVAKVLRPEQLRRLSQIALQLRGPLAFSEPDAVTALGLSEDQKKRVREMQQELEFGRLRLGPHGGEPPGFGPHGGRHRGPPPWLAQDWRRAQETIVETLTPQQRKKWDELIGAPFTSEIFFAPREPFDARRPHRP
jgi:serine/threonine protein kinase